MIAVTLKNKFLEKKYSLEEREICYLYSYLFIYDCEFKMGIFANGQAFLSGEMLRVFRDRIRNALNAIITTCYEGPDHKMHSKYPGRYVKFTFEGKTYTVDYALSTTGKLMYAISIRLAFVDQIIDADGELMLEVFDIS